MKRKYTVPVHVDLDKLRVEANRRRAALTAAGCSTYVLGFRSDSPSIVCLCCGLGSANAYDIQERYCGFCHARHTEATEPDHA